MKALFKRKPAKVCTNNACCASCIGAHEQIQVALKVMDQSLAEKRRVKTAAARLRETVSTCFPEGPIKAMP